MKNRTVKRKACWITDDSYLVPTFISISSFLQWCNVPVIVYYYGRNVDNVHEMFDYWISRGKVVIEHIPQSFFSIAVDAINQEFENQIKNREVRFYVAGLSNEELAIYYFDSDIVFDAHCVELFDIVFTESSQICGCVEQMHVIDNKIFFERNKLHKSSEHLSLERQLSLYKMVYGENCSKWLNNPQYNNGVLVFYNARRLASCWYSEYLKGLCCKHVNPGDDQVPLVSALYQQNETKIIELHSKFNSKGQLSGNYSVYHATGGQWRGELISVLLNLRCMTNMSDYARISKQIIDKYCDRKQLTKIIVPTQQPILFYSIEGFFFFSDAYSYLFNVLSEGNVFVEVGTYKGKSICYMAEMVKLHKKNIKLFSIDNYSNCGFSNQITFEEAKNNLIIRHLDDVVLINGDSVDIAETFNDNSVDCVFLDGDHRYQSVINDLSSWYRKLKSGGFLAGDDYTRVFSVQEAVDDFCEINELEFDVLNQCYIIRKP